jgi:tetratricopeptide (TPR) repeat protein
MNNNRTAKSLTAIFLIWTFFLNGLPVAAQDLPPTEDLSLGSGVFVFRSGSGKASQKKFVARTPLKIKRAKTERAATTQKIRRQYENSAVAVARRKRVKPIAPTVAATQTAAAKNPKEGSLLLTGAGQYSFNEKKYDEAIEFYIEAIDLDENNQDAKLGASDALTAKGDELMAVEQVRNARNFYEDAVRYNDKNPAAYAGLGDVFEALDENEKALTNYEKAYQLDNNLTEIYTPLGILYYGKNDISKADDFLSRALTTDKENAAANYYLGLIRLKQKRFDDAKTVLQQSIKSDANQAESHYNLGAAFDALNEDASAISEYQEAIRLNPKYMEAYFGLGTIYYGQKNYNDALTAYKKVVELQNTNGEAHANLGDVYRQLGKWGEAEGEYRLATVFIKDDAELYSKFGYVLGKQFKWNNAIEQLLKANALSADSLDYTNLGWAYYNAAQYDLRLKPPRPDDATAKLQLAKTALQKSVELKDNFAPAFLNLGITLNDLKEYQAASVALKRATELRKNWIFAINELGIAYRQLKDYGNAVEQFKKTVELDEKFAIGWYNLGEAEFRSGNVKGAKKAQEKLQPLNRNLANSLEIMILGAKLK